MQSLPTVGSSGGTRRARLNGLDSPASVVISPNVRGEMERALADLQHVVMAGEVEPVDDVGD